MFLLTTRPSMQSQKELVQSDIEVGRSGREDDRRTPGFGDPRRLALHGQKPYEDSRITAHSHAKLERPAQGVGRARQSTRTALADTTGDDNRYNDDYLSKYQLPLPRRQLPRQQ